MRYNTFLHTPFSVFMAFMAFMAFKRQHSSQFSDQRRPTQPQSSDMFKPLIKTLIRDSIVYSFGPDLKSIIDNPTVIPKGTEVPISKHVLLGISEAHCHIKSFDNSHELYVMCPVYWDDKYGCLCDTQLTVTGSIFTGESDHRAATIRELNEEFGISCFPRDLVECSKDVKIPGKYDRTATTFVLDASNASPFVSSVSTSHGTDDKNRKVQVAVYGTLPQLQSLATRITDRAHSKDLTGIRGIRLISLDDFFAGFN